MTCFGDLIGAITFRHGDNKGYWRQRWCAKQSEIVMRTPNPFAENPVYSLSILSIIGITRRADSHIWNFGLFSVTALQLLSRQSKNQARLEHMICTYIHVIRR